MATSRAACRLKGDLSGCSAPVTTSSLRPRRSKIELWVAPCALPCPTGYRGNTVNRELEPLTLHVETRKDAIHIEDSAGQTTTRPHATSCYTKDGALVICAYGSVHEVLAPGTWKRHWKAAAPVEAEAATLLTLSSTAGIGGSL